MGKNLGRVFFIKQGCMFLGDVLEIRHYENSIYVQK
jgi:hypothetical protein